jgi:hypothetical protein
LDGASGLAGLAEAFAGDFVEAFVDGLVGAAEGFSGAWAEGFCAIRGGAPPPLPKTSLNSAI